MTKRMDREVAAAHGERIRAEYDEFVAFKKARIQQLMAEVEAQAQAEIEAKRVALSQSVRKAYQLGVPKTVLREAVRAYTNQPSWLAVWDAAEGVLPVVERGSAAPKQVVPFEIIPEDPADKGAKYIDAGKKAKLIVRCGPDGLEWDKPVEIPLERKALAGGWIPDPDAEPWYYEENGQRYMTRDTTHLFEWGESESEAIERIEQEYRPKKKQ